MNYLQFDFEINGTINSDSLLAILSVNNFEGFEETENALKAFIPEDIFNEDSFIEVMAIFPGAKYNVAVVENINWNAEWEANFQPVIIDDFAGIRAHFHEPLKNVAHELIITPKMSFGTGHHATTHMMVQLMREVDFINRSVFDFGTGTGVLAILATQLGAGKVVAGDNDEWSIENAKENFTQNSTPEIDLIQLDTLPENKTFDIILANINLNIILLNMGGISKSLNSSGTILLSGFLINDIQAIKESLNLNGLMFKNYIENNNWTAITATKKQ